MTTYTTRQTTKKDSIAMMTALSDAGLEIEVKTFNGVKIYTVRTEKGKLWEASIKGNISHVRYIADLFNQEAK